MNSTRLSRRCEPGVRCCEGLTGDGGFAPRLLPHVPDTFVLVVDRKLQFLPTFTSLQSCLTVLTTWRPLPPEQIFQETTGRSRNVFCVLASEVPQHRFCSILLVTHISLFMLARVYTGGVNARQESLGAILEVDCLTKLRPGSFTESKTTSLYLTLEMDAILVPP